MMSGGSLVDLAIQYHYGIGVKENISEAIRYYKEAIEFNRDPLSCITLAAICSDDTFFNLNLNESENLLEVFFSRDNTLDDLQDYLNGYDEQYYRYLKKWLIKFAKEGNSKAMVKLGILNFSGKINTIDIERLIEKANNDDSNSIFRLAEEYYNGDYFEQDLRKAFDLCLKSAEMGNLEAMVQLGHCYNDGLGIEQDSTKILLWWKRAADNGSVEALRILAEIEYVDGDFFDEWIILNELALDEDEISMYNLGAMYFNGEGVSNNYNVAIDWFIKSAEKLYVPAIEILIKLYRNQELGFIDEDKAFYWQERLNGINQKTDSNVFTSNKDEALRWWSAASKIDNFQAKKLLKTYFNH